MASDEVVQFGVVDALVEQYETYEDYLDSHISKTDLFYLEDMEMARHLVELGYRGNGEILRRDEFDERKRAQEAVRAQKMNQKPKVLASEGKNLEGFPLLQALAQREEAVLSGKLTTVVYIRDKNERGQEISGYIDYGHRLRTDNLDQVFSLKKRFLPKTQDLSFYNWETQVATSNHSPNFQVVYDPANGLLFKNKRDRKVLNVDPKAKPGDNTTRTELETPEYAQVVIFDHLTRRRG